AQEVWRRRFGGEPAEDAATRARQMRFLAGRGFSTEVIRRVVRGAEKFGGAAD
ncbi:MAG TPA: RecX family transcriptional regulator, partial [Methylibium sp.]